MNPVYDRQVSLLIQVIPFLAKRSCFALHGGTAINLFIREMPRLSVDIDLTYIHTGQRDEALRDIQNTLTEVARDLEASISGLRVVGPQNTPGESKLYCAKDGVQIKVEVNTIMRGLIEEPQRYRLCQAAEERYGRFCEMHIVGLSQLYGGKICAALDRQHPRDLFDLDHLMKEGSNLMVYKRGIIYALLSSNRPLHELLNPRFEDQRKSFENQFVGMTNSSFTYDQFEAARTNLSDIILRGWTEDELQFLVDVMERKSPANFQDLMDYPSIRWKVKNLEILWTKSQEKYSHQLSELHGVLDKMKR